MWSRICEKKFIIGILFTFLLILVFYRWSECGFEHQTCKWQDWTGFGEFVAPSGIKLTRTLWDWLGILIVPLFLAYGVWRLNKSQKQSEQQIETDKQRQISLENYFDKMSELLLEENLRGVIKQESEGKGNSTEARKIARTRTLGLMQVMDSERKAQALQFIYESDLINKENPIIELLGIDLSDSNLSKASLQKAKIVGADFTNGNLEGAILTEADLNGSLFINSKFKDANLAKVNFELADFTNANFTNANFTGGIVKAAIFDKADLSSAQNFTQEMLDTVGSCKGAILPPNLKWIY